MPLFPQRHKVPVDVADYGFRLKQTSYRYEKTPYFLVTLSLTLSLTLSSFLPFGSGSVFGMQITMISSANSHLEFFDRVKLPH